MPILILLIILDLAIIGWVLYVGVRDKEVIAEGAHGVPEATSPEVQARVVPTSAAPVDTRFIRAERAEQQAVSETPAPVSSESVVQIRPPAPKPEESAGSGENA